MVSSTKNNCYSKLIFQPQSLQIASIYHHYTIYILLNEVGVTQMSSLDVDGKHGSSFIDEFGSCSSEITSVSPVKKYIFN